MLTRHLPKSSRPPPPTSAHGAPLPKIPLSLHNEASRGFFLTFELRIFSDADIRKFAGK